MLFDDMNPTDAPATDAPAEEGGVPAAPAEGGESTEGGAATM